LHFFTSCTKCKVSKTTVDGNTPLHYLIKNFPNTIGDKEEAYKKLVRKLIDLGLDPLAENKSGETVLHTAALAGRSNALNFLLSYTQKNKGWKYAINSQNIFGETPLHLAVRSVSYACVEVLLSWGVDVNIRNNEGRCAIDLAQSEEMIGLLARYKKRKEKGEEKLLGTGYKKKVVAARKALGQVEAKREIAEIQKMKDWLIQLKLPIEYLDLLVDDGFDDLESMKLITEEDLIQLGIVKTGHRRKITNWIANN